MKNSAYLPNYFSEQKGVQEKYLNMVVKINPVYWLKRNQHMAGKNIMANNWFKFGKYIDVSFSLQRNETRAT